MPYYQKVLFFKIVSDGRLDIIKRFVSTDWFSSAGEKEGKFLNENGETPLLVAIAHSQFETLKFLVQELEAPTGQTDPKKTIIDSWNGNIYSDITPLLTAIIFHDYDFVKYLIGLEKGESSVYLKSVMSSKLPRLQKIEALELIGSAYVFYGSQQAFRYGIPCLKQALLLRQSTDDGESVIPKIIHRLSDHAQQAIGNISEMTTIEELEQVAGDYHRLYIEAFFVSQRILSRLVPGPYPYYLNFLYFYAIKSLNQCQYDRTIGISFLILESFKPCQWKTLRSVRKDVLYLLNLTNTVLSGSLKRLFQSAEDVSELVTFSNVMIALDFGFAHVAQDLTDFAEQSCSHKVFYKSIETKYVFDLILIACEMLPKFSQLQRFQFKRNLAEFIQVVEKSGVSKVHPLYRACNLPDVPIHLIELLIAVGADPNIIVHDNTLLHLLAKKNWNSVHKAVEILINSGASLDRENEYGRSAQYLFEVREKYRYLRQGEAPHPNVFEKVLQLKEEYISLQKKKHLTVLPLTYHSAKAIQKYEIPFEGKLPSFLCNIVFDAMKLRL